MQQRRLRPGDVLDDYCPRERRVTDHAIVAMIDDKIQQTRCVSCDTEHEYKQARVPPQRKKKASAALFNQVLDGLQPPARPASQPTEAADELEPPLDAPATPPEPPEASWPLAADASESRPEPPNASSDGAEVEPDDGPEDGPVRRPLIRAQLPRHEGQPPPTRAIPEFTVRQSKNGRGNRPVGAQRPGGGRRRGVDMQGSAGPSRFGGPRQPGGHGRHGGGDRSHGAGGWSGNRPERGRGGRGRGGKKR